MSFAHATRYKFRFPSIQGSLTVEDLWDLQLESSVGTKATLNTIAIGLNHEIKGSETENFVRPNAKVDEGLLMKFDIVKHIIQVKLDERKAAKNKAAHLAQNQKIMEIIEAKGDKALEGKSIAALKKMLVDTGESSDEDEEAA